MKGMDLSVVPYGHIRKAETDHVVDGDMDETKSVEKNRRSSTEPVVDPVVMNPKTGKMMVKYRECMKNHAASIGGHANDGCGEFMPAGESLTCAACGCHRNFHRREVPGGGEHHYHHHHLLHSPQPPPPPLPGPPPMLMYNGGPTTPRWDKKMRIFTASAHSTPHPHQLHAGMVIGDVNSNDLFHNDDDDDDDPEGHYDRRSETPERELGTGTGTATTASFRNKRFRTKFTQEQKERMLEFAERLGWRIQKHDEMVLTQFCSDLGIKRNVLKVWMHNNKNAHRRKESAPQSPPVLPPPPPPAPPQPVGV